MSPLIRSGRWLAVALIFLAATGCRRGGNENEQEQVKNDFTAFRQALLAVQPDRIVAHLPQDVGDYILRINGEGDRATTSPAAAAPCVDLLLRTVLHDKVSPELRAHLTLPLLVQRLGQRGLLGSREVRDLSLGQVVVTGSRASAELYFQGNLMPLRLPFVKQAGLWKVDLLAMLPYAEILMRLDRAVTGRTESQQVARIVAPLPPL